MADDVLLDAAAGYLETEGAQKAGRAFARWAKRKTVSNVDAMFIAFFRTYTKRLGQFGPDGVTLNRDAIRGVRDGRQP